MELSTVIWQNAIKKDTIYLDIDGHIRNVVFANTNLKKWQVFQFSKAKIMAKIQTNLKRRTKLENKQTIRSRQ